MDIKHLCFAYDAVPTVYDVSFTIREGKVTTVLGPNGCGKTTLFKLLTRELRPAKGSVTIRGRNIYELERRDFARGVAMVQQHNTAAADITVERLVSFGRTPYQRFARTNRKRDKEKVSEAMAITDVLKYADRPVGTLSGGQVQRVWLAMALAQEPSYLFLDEPTTFLDIRYQMQILETVKRLNRDFGMTVIMVLHDINQAIAYSHEIFCMKEGRMLISGTPEEVVTGENMRKLYDMDMEIISIGGRKHVVAESAAYRTEGGSP